MNNIMLCYTIFRTKWGYFGLAGTDEAVCRTLLPGLHRQEIEQHLLECFCSAGANFQWDKDFQRDLRERIAAYYEGEPVDFSNDPVVSLAAPGPEGPRPEGRPRSGPLGRGRARASGLRVGEGSGPFAHRVLQACRKIAFGRTTTYSDLARQVGSPRAARAVGGVMARNPIPLIIPCHRVLRADGGLGGFSAPGGIAIKQKMLHHEQSPRR